ncbi:hypothetical protein RchiOBHm_Chr4g0385751 [Rosa chinensis]|uniref:Uncharacterized protein n=1 Tax=Rosa chinensis TaxID=74649 RepID=A0A2P6QP41_ROSCH|nr:hypothetical protein RchiOBHm_Chr4g0385751 [Rosa chinensis]
MCWARPNIYRHTLLHINTSMTFETSQSPPSPSETGLTPVLLEAGSYLREAADRTLLVFEMAI